MNNGINLLINRKPKSDSFKNALLATRIIAVVLLVVVSLCSISLFALKVFSPIPSLVKEEQSLLAELSLLQVKRDRYDLLVDRLKNISAIIEGRPNYDEALGKIIEIIPDNVSIDSLNIDRSGASFTVSSSSLSPINQISEGMINASLNKEIFSEVILGDLTFSATNNSYSLSIDAKFL